MTTIKGPSSPATSGVKPSTTPQPAATTPPPASDTIVEVKSTPWAATGGQKFSGSGSATLGPAVLKGSADGVYGDGSLQSAELKFSALAQLKELQRAGMINVGADGTVTLKNDKLDSATLNGLLSLTLGKNVEADAKGKLTLVGGKVDGSLATTFKGAWNNTELDGQMNLGFKKGVPQTTVDATLKQLLGPNSGVTAGVKADLAGGHINSGELTVGAFTRLKQLGDGGSIDLKGGATVDVKDGKVDKGEISALLSVMAGANLGLTASGDIARTDGGPMDASFKSSLDATWNNTKVDANGDLALKDGVLSGDAQATVTKLLGDGNVRSLTAKVVDDGQGQLQLSALAELKRLQKNGSLDVKADGSVTVKDKKLQGKVDGLLSLVAGKSVSLNASGQLTTDGKKVDGNLTADFKGTWARTQLNASGNLAVTGGKLTGDAKVHVQQLLGDATTATLDASTNGVSTADVSASVLTRLKKLGDGGAINLKTDGSVDIKNGQVDQTELGAALSVLDGKKLTLNAQGQMVDAQGKIDTKFSGDLKAAWDNTTLSGSGALELKEGVVSGNAQAQLTQVLGKDTVGTLQGSILSDGKGDLKLSAMAELKRMQQAGSIDVKADGSVDVKDGKLTGVVNGLLSMTAGKTVSLNATGQLTSDGKTVDGNLSADFQGAWASTQLTANGNLTLKQGGVDGNAKLHLQQLIGKNATATLDANVNKGGIATADVHATAFTRLKQLGDGGAVDLTTTGDLQIKNNKIDSAQLSALLSVASGKSLNVTAQGNVQLQGGKVDGDFKANLKAAWDNTTVTGDGALHVKDGVVSGNVEGALTQVLGKDTTATLKGSFADDGKGDVKMSALAELKRMQTDGTLDVKADGTVEVRDGKYHATVNGLLSLVEGKSVKLNAKGQLTDDDGVVSGNLAADFKGAWKSTKLTDSGNLTLNKDGTVTGEDKAHLEQLLGKNASVTLDADVDQGGVKTADVRAQALTRLKQLADGGSIDLKTNGDLQIKNNKVDRAELGALLSVMAGKSLSVSAQGDVVMSDGGKVDANFKGNLKAAWDDTKLTADGALALKDGQLSGNAQAKLTRLIGKDTTETLKGGFSTSNGQLKLDALADLKRVSQNGSFDVSTDGTVTLKDGTLKAKIESDLSLVSGKSVKLNAKNQIEVADQNGKLTLDAALSGDFARTWASTQLTTSGNLTYKNGALDGNAKVHVQQLLGKSGAATLDAAVDKGGIASAGLQANAFTRLKQLGADGSIDLKADGSVQIKDNKVTHAEVEALLSAVKGQSVSLDAGGKVTWDGKNVDTTFTGDFKKAWGATSVNGDGSISLVNGDLAGVQGSLDAVVGKNFSASLKSSWQKDGPVDTEIKVAAFNRLKQLGGDGGIDISPSGDVSIKDGKIDRAEVAALLSVVSGKDLNLSTSGKVVYADGKVDTAFAANLAAVWHGTDVKGAVTVDDGKLKGNVSAVFGDGAKVKGGAQLEVDGVDQQRLTAKLQGKGGTDIVDGALQLDHGKISSASLTTNLVSGGTDKNNVALDGVLTVGSDAAAASLKAQMKAGALGGALGVGVASASSIYHPTDKDPLRKAIADKGGVWAERKITFDANANLNAGTTVNVDGIQVGLGIKADAEKKREIDLLTLHPSEADAKAQSPLTVVHVPKTAADFKQMLKVGEQYSDSGVRTIGVGGDVSVGVGAGPVAGTVSGSAYYQLTADMRRDVMRDSEDKFTVRYAFNGGKVDVKTVAASLGVDAGKLLGGLKGPAGDLGQKAAPMIDQLAKIGISAKMEKTEKGGMVLVAHYDTSNPAAASAFEHMISEEQNATQLAAQTRTSGVTVDKLEATDIKATTKDKAFNLSVLNWDSMSRALDAKKQSWKPGDFVSVEAADQLNDKKTPNTEKRFDTRLIHQTTVKCETPLSADDTITTHGELKVHVPTLTEKGEATLDDSTAMLSMRMSLGDKKTGEKDTLAYLDQMISGMQAMGYKPSEYASFTSMRNAIAAGNEPGKDPVIPLPFGLGIGDKRMGDLTANLEGFLGPKGITHVFANASGKQLRDDYLDLPRPGDAPLVTLTGTRAAIEKAEGGKLVASPNGGWDLQKDGKTIANLSDAEIAALRDAITGLPKQFDMSDPQTVTRLNASKLPNPIVVRGNDFTSSANLLKRADNYGEFGAQLGTLIAENTPPQQNPGESKQAYDARLEQWKDSSLYKKPDVYWQQVNDLYAKGIAQDGTPDAALVSMKRAGSSYVYGKAWITMDPAKYKAIIDAGRANVQRFGAADVLAQARATVLPNGDVVVPASDALKSNPNAGPAFAGLQLLGGQGVTGTVSGNTVTYSGINWQSPQVRQAMATFLSSTDAKPGQLKLDRLPPAQQGPLLQTLFGGAATLDNGNVVFDNQDGRYNMVHFGDALKMYGNAFGAYEPGEPPPLFPSAVPIDEPGKQQSYDVKGLIVRHNGHDSHWGDAFDGIENQANADGSAKDLAATGPTHDNPEGWILVSR
jgi:hypothetical protein